MTDFSMWEEEEFCCSLLQSAAKQVFSTVDIRFEPSITLIGLSNNSESPDSVSVVSTGDFKISKDLFSSVFQRVREIKSGYEEAEINLSNDCYWNRGNDKFYNRSIKDAIIELLNSNIKSSECCYVTAPISFREYLICVVLTLQREIIDLYPSLLTSSLEIRDGLIDDDVPTSFIESIILTFWGELFHEFQLNYPGSGINGLNTEELLRKSAKYFMESISWRIAGTLNQGAQSLFSSCNNIAAAYYEKNIVKGRLVLGAESHKEIRDVVKFAQPTRLREIRGARKLLELASQDYALHTDSENTFGLAEYQNSNPDKEDLFTIFFLGHQHWDVQYCENVLMRVKYGIPYLPRPSYSREKLNQDLNHLFEGISSDQITNIINLVDVAESEKHGTMLLITEKAQTEAQRLGNQATQIEPTKLSPDLLKNLTPIDGALLIHPDGNCYAIGAILDGMATQDGDPTRGARYNSALRYVKTYPKNCLAIVVSEDGGLDFIS